MLASKKEIGTYLAAVSELQRITLKTRLVVFPSRYYVHMHMHHFWLYLKQALDMCLRYHQRMSSSRRGQVDAFRPETHAACLCGPIQQVISTPWWVNYGMSMDINNDLS